jgi:hypothetical protein
MLSPTFGDGANAVRQLTATGLLLMSFAPQEQRAHSPRLAAAFFPLARTITVPKGRHQTECI